MAVIDPYQHWPKNNNMNTKCNKSIQFIAKIKIPISKRCIFRKNSEIIRGTYVGISIGDNSWVIPDEKIKSVSNLESSQED